MLAGATVKVRCEHLGATLISSVELHAGSEFQTPNGPWWTFVVDRYYSKIGSNDWREETQTQPPNNHKKDPNEFK